MKSSVIILSVVLLFFQSSIIYSQSQNTEHLEIANKVLSSVPLVDGHNDLLLHYYYYKDRKGNLDEYDISKSTSGQTDIPRLKEGKVGAQFFTVFSFDDSSLTKSMLETVDCLYRIADRYKNDFSFAYSSNDIMDAFNEGKIAMLMNIEGGEQIENSLPMLRLYYQLGVRYLTLTWNYSNDWADAGFDSARHNGLNEFGKEVVREMNRLGMLIDISHVSDKVMKDVFKTSEAPVIYSHANSRKFVNTKRNVPDDILHLLKKNNGIIMVSFVPFFVNQEYADWFDLYEAVYDSLKMGNKETAKAIIEEWKIKNPEPKVPLTDLANHLDHIKNLIGADHIGIGSDFDGFTGVVEGLEDCSKFPNLLEELARRGWTEDELKKLASENFLRVFRETEKASQKLRSGKQASMMRIEN
ncbi:MAG: dipeptidase [Ignavibacteriaceae bacterium]|nr:dipeptidase [Ignavibacteriaceae bacterium]